jgi:hypothetical protein
MYVAGALVCPPFFIVASARSGTTFLRLALNAHPEVAVPPESRFITELYDGADEVNTSEFLERLAAHKRFTVWNLPVEVVAQLLGERTWVPYAEAIAAPYKAYAAQHGKRYWGDKTPRYIEHIPFLARLFPAARFIHPVRDGRNVALSYAHVSFGPKTVAAAAELWARRVSAGMRAGRALEPGRYLEILNEDLAEDPEGEMRDICRFLGLDFHPAMLSPEERRRGVVDKVTHSYDPTSAGRARMSDWKSDMPPTHVEMFEAVAGNVLSELGYERRFSDPGALAKLKARLARCGLPIGRLKATSPQS